MPGLLKNVLLTAVMVAAATVIVAIFAAMAVLFTAPPEHTNMPNAAAAVLVSLVVMVVALLFGMVFCVVTLFMAALTMPPVLALAQWLRLPRPAVDSVGGAVMGYICGMIAVDAIDTDKFANMITETSTYSVAVISVFFGGLLGFLRYLILVPRLAAAPAPAQPAVGAA